MPHIDGRPFTPDDLARLAEEIRSGPLASMLAEFVTAGADGPIAEILNRQGMHEGDVFPRERVLARDALAFLEASDYDAAGPAAWSHLSLMAQVGTLELLSPADPTQDSAIKRALAQYFPTSTQSGAILAQFMYRLGSRAEALFGSGTTISDTDVAVALRPASVHYGYNLDDPEERQALMDAIPEDEHPAIKAAIGEAAEAES